jgi:uncharacterized repeat protein (TIGR02543 family)
MNLLKKRYSRSLSLGLLAALAVLACILSACPTDGDPAPITYVVKFDVDGEQFATQNVASGEKVSKPADPSKEGYTFAGWYKDADKENPWSFDTDTVAGPTTLYAKWSEGKVRTYTVTFNVDKGSAVAAQPVVSGEKVPKPADPVKEGYTFAGWYKNSAKTTLWDFDTDTVTTNTTLYAKWIEGNLPSFTVTFDVDSGSAVAARTVVSGDKVPKPKDPAREGYLFDGWYKESAKTTPWNFATDTVTADTTLYAKWTKTFTVTFNADGGSPAPVDQTVRQGGLVARPADPAKAGFALVDWYKEAAGTTLWNFGTDTVTADTTIYAKWIPVYTVTFNVDGGSEVASQTVQQGGKVTEPEKTPTRGGFAFVGWYKEAAGTTKWNFATDAVTTNTTIYAKWTRALTVTFKELADEVIDLSQEEDQTLSKSNWDQLNVEVSNTAGYSSIRWYADGTGWQSGTNYYVQASNFSLGPHVLTAVVLKSDGTIYSKPLNFQVTE